MSINILALIVTGVLFLTGCVPPGGEKGGGSSIMSFLPFILIFALFYFLILRPQQKQQRERKEMLESVKKGDTVLTTGGIYGKVVNINEDELTVEIAKGINVRMIRSGVSGVSRKDDK